MPKLTDVFENSAFLSEMRLKTAMEIARLKTEADRYEELEKFAAESGDTVAANTLTKMRLNAAIEIVRLRKEADKYQQIGKLAVESGDVVAAEKVIAAPAPIRRIDNERQKTTTKQAAQEPVKARESVSDWVDKQALKLFSELATNKSLTA